jgi:hypothetical protein
VDVMAGHNVAGEAALIHHEDLVSLAGQEHGGGGAGAASAYNDCVVHRGCPP